MKATLAMHALRIPGTSLTQAIEMQHALERGSRSSGSEGRVREDGQAGNRDRSHAASVADGFIIMKPRSECPTRKSRRRNSSRNWKRR